MILEKSNDLSVLNKFEDNNRPTISAVINTLNEEKNISFVLRSVKSWVDEIILVDMHSEDKTVEIAEGFGAEIYYYERTISFEKARAYAVSKATKDWIVMIDADELIPFNLSKRLIDIATKDEADIVSIPRINYLLGTRILHTGWDPEQDRQMRFFKNGFLEIEIKLHHVNIPKYGARVVFLPYKEDEAIVHFNYTNSFHFIEKLNKYTTLHAHQMHEQGVKSNTTAALLGMIDGFMHRYYRNNGYLDGWRGLYLSLFMGFYNLAIQAKLNELETIGEEENIKEIYIKRAESLLKEYES